MSTLSFFSFLSIVLIATTSFAQATEPLHKDPYGFDIKVTLSDKAKKYLERKKEKVEIFADYSGFPKKGQEKYACANGRIDISRGEELIILPHLEGRVHISGKKIDLDRLSKTRNPLIVNLGIVSTYRRGGCNMLACDYIFGSLKKVQSLSPVALHCSLIKENEDWNVKAFPEHKNETK